MEAADADVDVGSGSGAAGGTCGAGGAEGAASVDSTERSQWRTESGGHRERGWRRWKRSRSPLYIDGMSESGIQESSSEDDFSQRTKYS